MSRNFPLSGEKGFPKVLYRSGGVCENKVDAIGLFTSPGERATGNLQICGQVDVVRFEVFIFNIHCSFQRYQRCKHAGVGGR